MKKKIYVLIGPAAIGKTTYTRNTSIPFEQLALVSRDDVVARVSDRYNLSIDDLYYFPPHDAVLGTYIPGFEWCGRVIVSPSVVVHLHPFSYEYLDSVNAEINYGFYNDFQAALRNAKKNYVIIDRVHMRSKERMAYFDFLRVRKEYFVTAVLFNFKDADTLDVIEQLSEIRNKELIEADKRPRSVPRAVQENMIKFYEEPRLDEGFDSILTVDTLPQLREFLAAKKAYL